MADESNPPKLYPYNLRAGGVSLYQLIVCEAHLSCLGTGRRASTRPLSLYYTSSRKCENTRGGTSRISHTYENFAFSCVIVILNSELKTSQWYLDRLLMRKVTNSLNCWC